MSYALDAFQEFANDLTITDTNAATMSVAKTIDYSADRNIGVGEPIAVGVKVDEIEGGGSETYVAHLETSSTSNFAAVVSLGTITIDKDKPATSYVHYIPKDTRMLRYLRLRLVLTGGGAEMKYSAHVGPASTFDSWTSYPVGYTVENVVSS